MAGRRLEFNLHNAPNSKNLRQSSTQESLLLKTHKLVCFLAKLYFGVGVWEMGRIKREVGIFADSTYPS